MIEQMLKSLILFTVMSSLSLACQTAACWNKPGAKVYKEIEQEWSVNDQLAKKHFASLSFDEQITVALYARRCPDDPRIMPLLEVGGEEKIPTIVNRIETEPLFFEKGQLVLSLIGINRRCKCISSDPEIIRRLESIAESSYGGSRKSDSYVKLYNDHVIALKHQFR